MYFKELNKAMRLCAKHPKALFVGQAVAYDGQAAFKTFAGVPMKQRIEMPVFEDTQLGFCTGLALEGYLPICFYPRFDFLIMAANQLLNHLDKLPLMGPFRPKVIIRTAVGRTRPLDPGPQHTQDYSFPLRQMLKTVNVHTLSKAELIVPAYKLALTSERSTILVEQMSRY